MPAEGSRHVFSASWCSFVMLLPRDCAPDGEFFSEPKALASNSRIDRPDHGAAHVGETDQKHICSICKQEGHNKRTCTQNTKDQHPSERAKKRPGAGSQAGSIARMDDRDREKQRELWREQKKIQYQRKVEACRGDPARMEKLRAQEAERRRKYARKGCRTENPP
jgi:hypothetical protein